MMHTPPYTPIVNSIDEYALGQTFEQLVVSKFEPYLGNSISQLCTRLSVSEKGGAAGICRKLTKTILGIPLQHRIEEFEKGDVLIRVVCTDHPKYPRAPRRYFLWHINRSDTKIYLQKVEFWTPVW